MDSRVRGNDSKSRRQTLRYHSCGSRNPLSSKQWIPAFTGMTASGKWIPAFAGMTAKGQMDSRVRGNDSKGRRQTPRCHSCGSRDSRVRGNDSKGQMDSRFRGKDRHRTPPLSFLRKQESTL
ncbi:hypothetical protein QUF72_09800 [Desulfobacterales bacterium HSG2]|nr:hypothetical protein [Desulfobacterales bacterium HSG2]